MELLPATHSNELLTGSGKTDECDVYGAVKAFRVTSEGARLRVGTGNAYLRLRLRYFEGRVVSDGGLSRHLVFVVDAQKSSR
jgi:hypothetical protein